MIIVFELATGDYDTIENHLYFIEYESIEKYRQDLLTSVNNLEKFECQNGVICLTPLLYSSPQLNPTDLFVNKYKGSGKSRVITGKADCFVLTPLDEWLERQKRDCRDYGKPFAYDLQKHVKID